MTKYDIDYNDKDMYGTTSLAKASRLKTRKSFSYLAKIVIVNVCAHGVTFIRNFANL